MYKYQQQPKFKLTKEMVENAEPHSFIHSGIGLRQHPWFNNAKKVEDGGCLEDDGVSAEMGYVIFRGGIADWCVYHSFDANLTYADYLDDPKIKNLPPEMIVKFGGKLHSEDEIRSLVDCTDEVFEMYRH